MNSCTKKLILSSMAAMLLTAGTPALAEEVPSHCSEKIYEGEGWNKKSARMTWRAKVLTDSSLPTSISEFIMKAIKQGDDVLWRYARDKEYSKKYWGKVTVAKARPCSAIDEIL